LYDLFTNLGLLLELAEVKSVILNVLNARPEESSRVFLLLGQGFFTGLFLATYDVGAVSIFLEHFSEDELAIAFVASGAIGIIFTYLYSYFQARISFPKLVVGFLLLIVSANILVWYGLKNFSTTTSIFEFTEIVNFTNFESIAFISFIFALPFSYIGLLIFWGTFGRLFNVRQSKRIIGGIDTGQLVASIFALFTIAYLIDNKILVAADLFFISMVSISGLFIFFFIISAKYRLGDEGEKDIKGTYPFVKLMKNKYMRLMATFVIISMIAATFVDFTFLNVTKIQWENNPSDIGAFVARFEAAVVIFSFLFQTFVTDYMIENYGLKISLLVNPLLIMVLIAISGLIGLINIESDFVWFFMIICITKLFIDSLKDALDGPTFKLYFLPIDSKIRFDVNTKIEGVVAAFASMIAGLLLIGMNSLKTNFQLLDLNGILLVVVFLLIPILFAWFFTTGKMHTYYKISLQNALTALKGTGIKLVPGYKEIINKEQAKSNESEVFYSLKLMERFEPGAFEESINSIDSAIQPNGRLAELVQQVETEKSSMKELAEQALSSVAADGGKKLSDKELYDLSKAPSAKKKIAAAIHLRESINDENIFVLLDLLRDFSSTVRFEAIKTARIVKRPEAWNLVAELLDHKEYSNEAASALIAGGDDALPMVNQLFNKSDKSRDCLLLAVKIMSDVSSDMAIEFLWEKLEYPDRKITREILVTLQKNKAEATGNRIARVNTQLDLEISKAIWNMAAISELKETEANERLIDSLQREIKSNFEFIYIYLSLIYDQSSIQLVKDNVDLGSADGITYAIELLDIFIDKELRPKLYPLIEDSSVSDKLEKLQIFFPRITFNELQTLNYIINRDCNLINRWTKACALDSLLAQEKAVINAGLIGHLFNPDLLLAENAAKVIKRIDEKEFFKILDRLPEKRKYFLRNKFRASQSEEQIGRFPMRFDRILHLLDIGLFGKISGIHVSELADKFQVIKTKSGDHANLDRVKGRDHLIIVDSGTIEIENGKSSVVHEDEVCTSLFFDNNSIKDCTLTSISDSVIYLLEINDYLSVMINYKELARETLGIIESFDKHMEVTN